MTDGTAISAIKLPLVRRLVAQNLPTVKSIHRQLDSPHRLSLASALKRGWLDPRTGRLRSSCGAVSQMNLFEVVEQRILDPDSIVVRISSGTDTCVNGSQHYSLATVLDAANTIANHDNYTSEVSWRNELLKALMATNTIPVEGEVRENLSPDDYSHLQSIIAPHGAKLGKGDRKLSAASIFLRSRKKKPEEKLPEKKPRGERLSLARAIQSGRVDPSTGTVTTITKQTITLKEAIELEVIDEEHSLIQDERTGHYRTVRSYLNDEMTPIEIWIHRPMATLLSPKEVGPFGRKRLNIGKRIPFASAQSLQLINPQSRTVLIPQTQTYVSILNAFFEGPLCRRRTVIYFSTTHEYIPVDILISSNPENVISELLFNRSLCVELQEDLVERNDRNRSPPHIIIPPFADSKPSATANLPLDLTTAVKLGWLDPQTGFVSDPFTGHRLLLKEAIEAGLIDGDRTVIRDPVTNEISSLNIILNKGEPVNVPYLVQLACSNDGNQLDDNQSSFLSSVTSQPLLDRAVEITLNGRETNEKRWISETEFQRELGTEILVRAHGVDRDIDNLRSNLIEAASKVGTGLAVALSAAAVGGTLGYQSNKDRIQRSQSFTPQGQLSSSENIQSTLRGADDLREKPESEFTYSPERMDTDNAERIGRLKPADIGGIRTNQYQAFVDNKQKSQQEDGIEEGVCPLGDSAVGNFKGVQQPMNTSMIEVNDKKSQHPDSIDQGDLTMLDSRQPSNYEEGFEIADKDKGTSNAQCDSVDKLGVNANKQSQSNFSHSKYEIELDQASSQGYDQRKESGKYFTDRISSKEIEDRQRLVDDAILSARRGLAEESQGSGTDKPIPEPEGDLQADKLAVKMVGSLDQSGKHPSDTSFQGMMKPRGDSTMKKIEDSSRETFQDDDFQIIGNQLPNSSVADVEGMYHWIESPSSSGLPRGRKDDIEGSESLAAHKNAATLESDNGRLQERDENQSDQSIYSSQEPVVCASSASGNGSNIKKVLMGVGSALAAAVGAPAIAGTMVYNASKEKQKPHGETSQALNEFMDVDQNNIVEVRPTPATMDDSEEQPHFQTLETFDHLSIPGSHVLDEYNSKSLQQGRSTASKDSKSGITGDGKADERSLRGAQDERARKKNVSSSQEDIVSSRCLSYKFFLYIIRHIF